MNIKFSILLFLILASALPNISMAQSNRKITDFNQNWLFEQDDWIGLTTASQFSWKDSAWIPVQTPHCFNAKDTFDETPGYYRGYAWYRKYFRLAESEKGRIIKIHFGAIGNVSEIWVNEKYCGKSYLGFVPVEIDITDKINFDTDNLIAVRVQNLHDEEVPPGRWRMDYNVFGGIYREVTIITLPKTHLVKEELMVTTPEVSSGESVIKVSAGVLNENAGTVPVEIRCTLKDGAKTVASFSQQANIPENLTIHCNQLSAKIKDVKLWSPDEPNLYTLETALFQDGKQTDQLAVKVGFRKAEFDAEKGFILNGKPLKLRGLNRHQDYPGLGSAVPVRLQIQDAVIMKDLGANFVRCSHYPQHESFLDACDSLGLLVYEEAVSWQHIGGDEFMNHMNDMMAAMIRRDRNHPSIILWGMMNEGRSAKMFEMEGKTAQLLDPTRPVSYAENHIDVGIKEGTIFMPGVSGLNYMLEEYDQLHKDFPQLKLLNTECTNGDKSLIGDLPSQMKAAAMIKSDLDFLESREWMAGSCIWCFHDYASEYKPVRPIQTSGVVDIYRRYKEAAWMLKARWNSEPFIRIAGNWYFTGEEGSTREVTVWNNCDEVHLYLNGKEINGTGPVWKVACQPGELKAVGRKGNEAVEYVLRTPGKATGLQFVSKEKNLKNDGFDAIPLVVQLVDSKGNAVPQNGKQVTFSIDGPGRLAGIGGQTVVKTADGQAAMVVQSTGGSGKITVTAKCEGLKETNYIINTEN